MALATEAAVRRREGGIPEGVRAELRFGLAAALMPWLVSRAVVLGTLALAHEVAKRTHAPEAIAARVHQGLLGWDAGWYETIARVGYGGAGHQSLRFFPLVPLLARGLAEASFLGVGTALLVVSNASALLGVALLAVLVRRESGDEGMARLVAWMFMLAPAAYTYVMGYSEATLLVLTSGTFLALRSGRWWWAACLGALAGLTRPLGSVLVLPALVEGLRQVREAGLAERARRLAAVVAPAVGTGAFLVFVALRYGGLLTPFRIQVQRKHRGLVADPLTTLLHDASLLIHHHHLGTALHLPWVLLSLFLLAVALRRLPASYGTFAAGVLLVAVTAPNLDSFERYALSAFPLVVAGATLCRSTTLERPVLVALAASMIGYGLLAFLNIAVP